MEHHSATEYIRENGLCKGIEETTGIYAITIDDHVVYVGKSKNLKSRTRKHIRNMLNGYKRNKYVLLNSAQLQNMIVNCYVIKECGEEDLDVLEKRYIDKYNPPLNSGKSSNVKDLTFDELVQNLSKYKLIDK